MKIAPQVIFYNFACSLEKYCFDLTSKGALDPSYILKCLKQIISKAGNTAFGLFSQQDAAEILSYVLEELCGESIHASESIGIYIRQTISCTVCQQYTSTEDYFLFSSCLLQSRSEVPKCLLRIKFLEWQKWVLL